MKIVFVCLGNICRSPLAHGIARKIIKENNLNIAVSSCGISGWHTNEPPHHLSIKTAKEKGIDISDLRSSKVTPYLEADLYIVMDDQNKQDMLHLGFPKDKVKKMGEFGFHGVDVEDPYNHPQEKFIEVYEMLEIAVSNLLKSITVQTASQKGKL